MKRFIYLDTDELNSYIAQIYNGLLIEKEETKEIQENKVSESTIEISGKMDAGAKLKGILNLDTEIIADAQTKSGKFESDLIRDIQKKIIHDESFDDLLEYLNTNKLLKNDDYKIGSFVSFNSKFKIFDLNYFLNLYTKDGFIDFMIKNESEKIDELLKFEKSKLNRGQNRNQNGTLKIIQENAKVTKQEIEMKYKSLENIIKAMKSIMPYEKIILVDKFFLATDDKYFRDNPEMLGFKYGGEISFLGYITNIVEQTQEVPEGLEVLTGFKNVVNSAMLNLLSNEKIFVVHPIAMYYE